jgi:IS30 family transposase
MGKHALTMAKVVVKRLIAYKNDVNTITSDKGYEFTGHEYIAKTHAKFFFTHYLFLPGKRIEQIYQWLNQAI